MNNDSHTLADQYTLIQEAAPFGIGSRLWSKAKSYVPGKAGRSGKSEGNFQRNVNSEFEKFNNWLYSRQNTKPTVGNFVTYFNQNVGLQTVQSPTLQALLKSDAKGTQAVFKEFTDFISAQTAPAAAPAAPATPAPQAAPQAQVPPQQATTPTPRP
jgi:hypothetical protein